MACSSSSNAGYQDYACGSVNLLCSDRSFVLPVVIVRTAADAKFFQTVMH